MTKRTVTIELASGLEARPIAMLVQLASCLLYTSHVSVCVHNGQEVFVHGRQAFAHIGTVFKPHLCVLGDGVDGGASGDGAHVVGAFSRRRNLIGIKGIDHGGQYLDGVQVAEFSIRVAALGMYAHTVAQGEMCIRDRV